MQKPILVMAGGTGGHVFPALAVAENLRQRGESIVWLGTRSGIEARVVPAADFAIEWLSVQGLRGKGMVTLVLAPFRLLRACWQALQVLRRTRPKAVLGMGGFVAGPGGLMAWLLNIPLYLHEQNSIIGLTNRILSRFATRSFFAFPDAAQSVPRSECIGNPVRASFADLGDPAARLQARMDKPLQLLVIGQPRGGCAEPVSARGDCLSGPGSTSPGASRITATPGSRPRWSALSRICRRPMSGLTWWSAVPAP
jgi:UDP-N-acetylglucosamine--N-acetylmuramyl-(pentapeptide) pyrophosphoryl-undecaprenol N-acetylglucosamine transferase